MRVGHFVYSPGWLSTAFTACLLVLLIWLGNWQADRAASKLLMRTAYDEAATGGVLRLDSKSHDLEALKFFTIDATGSFDGLHQFLLDNRTDGGQAGYHVLTALQLFDGGAVLVNRGWVRTGATRDVLPELVVPQGEVRLKGKLFPPPRVFLLGSSGYENTGWPKVVQSVDIEQMEKLLGYELLAEMVLMMSPDEPGGYARNWNPYHGISPERHRAYAFQWFALASALTIIYVAMTVRRSKPGNDK